MIRRPKQNWGHIPKCGMRPQFKAAGRTKMIDKELLDILACPACKSDVELKENKIICKKCHKKYPIKNGIPVMIIDEAQ